MYRALPQARKRAKAFPFLGSYVATVEVPFTSEIVERTLQSAGHHTVWAAPSLLLACVVAVEPIVP